MNDERWDELLYKISVKAKKMDRDLETRDDGRTTVETVLFDVGMGRMRLQRVSRPIILDKKMLYSKRIGGDTSTEYVYSETEKSHHVSLHRWSPEESTWVEVDFRKAFF